MTRRISFDLCLRLNDAEVKAGPLLYEDKLRSALDAPYQTWGGDELYPTLIEKAARLAYGIAVTVVFLELNGVTLDVDQDEAAHVIRAIGTRDPVNRQWLDASPHEAVDGRGRSGIPEKGDHQQRHTAGQG